MPWQSRHSDEQAITDTVGGAARTEVYEQDIAGAAFDEGADRRLAVLADDQVAFPMARDGRSSASAGRSLIITIGWAKRG